MIIDIFGADRKFFPVPGCRFRAGDDRLVVDRRADIGAKQPDTVGFFHNETAGPDCFLKRFLAGFGP